MRISDWSSDVCSSDLTVAAVARRHEISRQHIYQWRREMRLKGLTSMEPAHSLPVELSPDPPEAAGCGGLRSNAGGVEIGHRNGRVVREIGRASGRGRGCQEL